MVCACLQGWFTYKGMLSLKVKEKTGPDALGKTNGLGAP